MPISKYFGGHGDEVMASMKETYGDTAKAKSVFYATANKRKKKPGRSSARDQARALRPSRR